MEIKETEDIQELTRLNESVQSWHNLHYPEEFKPFNRTAVETALERLMVDEDWFALMAESDNTAIGYILGFVKRRPESAFQYEKVILYIDQIGVAESHRKQGVGKRLLESAIGRFKTEGITEIRLDHWSGNELAENFFVNNGFTYFNQSMRRTIKS